MRGARTREYKRNCASLIVNGKITVNWPGIGFSRCRCDGTFHASQCKIPDDFQGAVPCAQNVRGLERQQGVVSGVREVAGGQGALMTECAPPVLIRRTETK